jgi:cytochrome c
MRKIAITTFIIGVLALSVSPVLAQEKKGTREEAKAMAEKAAALYKENAEKALAAFQDKSGQFFDRDLYVFVNDSKGLFLAHGAKPALVGKPSLELKDANGFELIKAFLAVKDTAWVDYRWPDPSDNNKVKDKASYIIKVGENIVGVGYYKE